MLLLQSTLLSGFQTYVTATSSSDDIYYGTQNIIPEERKHRNYKEINLRMFV